MRRMTGLITVSLVCAYFLRAEIIYDETWDIGVDIKDIARVSIVIEKEDLPISSDGIKQTNLILTILPEGYSLTDQNATRVRFPQLTSLGGTARRCGIGLAFLRGSLRVLDSEHLIFDQSSGNWHEVQQPGTFGGLFFGIGAEALIGFLSKRIPQMTLLSTTFQFTNKIADYYHESQSQAFAEQVSYDYVWLPFHPIDPKWGPSAQKVSFTIEPLQKIDKSEPLAFLVDQVVKYLPPADDIGNNLEAKGSGRLDMAITFLPDCEREERNRNSPEDPPKVDFPRPVGYVNDFSGLLDQEEEQRIYLMIADYERKTTVQMAVLTLQSVSPYTDVDAYATDLFDDWGIGVEGKDNGILFLIVSEPRYTVLRVGYGMEAILTDEVCRTILDQDIIPEFKGGNYAGGLIRAIEEVIRILEGGVLKVPPSDVLPVMVFVGIPEGSYLRDEISYKQGKVLNDGLKHKVTLDSFSMQETEVTVEQFRQFVRETGYRTDAERNGWAYTLGSDGYPKKGKGLNWKSPGFDQSDNHPVVCVTWDDTQEFIRWLNRKGQVPPCRLPTEEEWEYAAGNGIKHTDYSWGNGNPIGRDGGNVCDETLHSVFKGRKRFKGYSDGYVYAAPVASFSPNEFGLFDMTGNVSEWCAVSDDGQYNKTRIFKGGSWDDHPFLCHIAYRGNGIRDVASTMCGFRVVIGP
ncbi:hypothetical protein CEE37_14390 [candidate division LCP-89 bacterium B3_LCP]|uniref:Sulfatase-modifying factor enzyme domain-containing protein n=1 Tax=candidate division LCP-89 bacterium B3_LCP TaxID=2012998 RepID=A0A532UPP3_UNCL8|nr:MAG: hypothetical protein CEE37_14390 [candidate division LCP-89 bacterium B3_LCP]